jgi:uncharacterized repeat protein (TIGR02543 family)
MKKLLLAMFIIPLLSCGTHENEPDEPNKPGEEPSSSSVPSSSSIGKTYHLTIKNESSVNLESVVWNGINFGNISIGHSSEKKVDDSTGIINFRIPNKGAARVLDARTRYVLALEPGSNEYIFFDGTPVEETANPSNYGTLVNLKKQNIKEVDITFILNGGFFDEPENQSFMLKADSGGKLSEVFSDAGVPIKEGYMLFDGWYTLASGGTKYPDTTTIKGNMTLQAHWVAYTSKIVGCWKDEINDDNDNICFSSGKTGWNEYTDEDGDIRGFTFNWTATNDEIEIKRTKVYVKFLDGDMYESSDPDDQEYAWLWETFDPEYFELYSFSTDGNILYIWYKEYTRTK